MGSGHNLGRSLTMGPNKYFTQNVSSILSLAFLCTSKGMYPMKGLCIQVHVMLLWDLAAIVYIGSGGERRGESSNTIQWFYTDGAAE